MSQFYVLSRHETRSGQGVENLIDRLHVSEIYELEENGARVKAAYPGCAEGIVSCQQPLAQAINTHLSADTYFTKAELCP